MTEPARGRASLTMQSDIHPVVLGAQRWDRGLVCAQRTVEIGRVGIAVVAIR